MSLALIAAIMLPKIVESVSGRTGKVIVATMKMATKIGVIAELRLKAVTTNAVTMKSAENANSSKYMLKKRSATIALFLSGIGIRMSKDACS